MNQRYLKNGRGLDVMLPARIVSGASGPMSSRTMNIDRGAELVLHAFENPVEPRMGIRLPKCRYQLQKLTALS